MIGRRKKTPASAAGAARAPDGIESTGSDMALADPRELPSREVTRFGHGSRVPGWDDAADLEKDPAQIPDPATTPVPAALRTEIEAHMAKYPDFRSAAIPALAAAQRVHGWCSPEAIWQAACVMRLTPGYLISVASFYDMLETKPVGRHSVYVCTNISCSLCGADELMRRFEDETAADPSFNVRHFECLGACDIAPMASVDGIYIGPITLDEVPKLVEQIRDGLPPLPNKQLRRRKCTDPGAARAVERNADPGPALAVAGGTDPVSPTETYGEPMGDSEPSGPPAAIEHAPPEPEPPAEDDKA
ncbi:MAG TPA: NAD(P)H-dependent oxidoreductase subunit E [Solirubrobacteraceae bacterium]|nr:NAD(P)H-dependent oxidoreductase subunit E [Solirubrobacteraceae bacterium]